MEEKVLFAGMWHFVNALFDRLGGVGSLADLNDFGRLLKLTGDFFDIGRECR